MDNIEQIYAKTFATTSAQKVIAHLRKITLERVLGPNASDAELRTLEGQRALVRQIEQLILRGKSNDKS